MSIENELAKQNIPSLAYFEAQAEWVKANNICLGDSVVFNNTKIPQWLIKDWGSNLIPSSNIKKFGYKFHIVDIRRDGIACSTPSMVTTSFILLPFTSLDKIYERLVRRPNYVKEQNKWIMEKRKTHKHIDYVVIKSHLDRYVYNWPCTFTISMTDAVGEILPVKEITNKGICVYIHGKTFYFPFNCVSPISEIGLSDAEKARCFQHKYNVKVGDFVKITSDSFPEVTNKIVEIISIPKTFGSYYFGFRDPHKEESCDKFITCSGFRLLTEEEKKIYLASGEEKKEEKKEELAVGDEVVITKDCFTEFKHSVKKGTIMKITATPCENNRNTTLKPSKYFYSLEDPKYPGRHNHKWFDRIQFEPLTKEQEPVKPSESQKPTIIYVKATKEIETGIRAKEFMERHHPNSYVQFYSYASAVEHRESLKPKRAVYVVGDNNKIAMLDHDSKKLEELNLVAYADRRSAQKVLDDRKKPQYFVVCKDTYHVVKSDKERCIEITGNQWPIFGNYQSAKEYAVEKKKQSESVPFYVVSSSHHTVYGGEVARTLIKKNPDWLTFNSHDDAKSYADMKKRQYDNILKIATEKKPAMWCHTHPSTPNIKEDYEKEFSADWAEADVNVIEWDAGIDKTKWNGPTLHPIPAFYSASQDKITAIADMSVMKSSKPNIIVRLLKHQFNYWLAEPAIKIWQRSKYVPITLAIAVTTGVGYECVKDPDFFKSILPKVTVKAPEIMDS